MRSVHVRLHVMREATVLRHVGVVNILMFTLLASACGDGSNSPTAPSPTPLSVALSARSVAVGTTVTATAINATGEVTWSVTPTMTVVASGSAATVTPVAAGTYTIAATSGGKTATATIAATDTKWSTDFRLVFTPSPNGSVGIGLSYVVNEVGISRKVTFTVESPTVVTFTYAVSGESPGTGLAGTGFAYWPTQSGVYTVTVTVEESKGSETAPVVLVGPGAFTK
jgi:hypothetical protein